MRSTWVARLLTLAFAAALCLPVGALAQASGCPTQAVQENGGSHLCFDAGGNKGHVHVWYPSNFDAGSAVTVVYMHGYNNDEQDTNGVRRQSGSYIDRIWDSHGLGRQFSASRLNAVFIAAEGPIGNKSEIDNDDRYATVLWGSLGALMNAVQQKVSFGLPSSVIGIGHSAGMFTIEKFQSDARLKHVMTLDSMYTKDSLPGWYNGNDTRRLTLVGGNAQQNTQTANLAHELGFGGPSKTVVGTPSSLSQEQRDARGLYVYSKLSHMAVVTGGSVIPLILSRASSSTVEAAGAGGASNEPTPAIVLAPTQFEPPDLEIPVPGVTFSQAVRADGTVTVPFLAQYITGVYAYAVGIVGLVAAVFIVIGGFQYILARGDAGRISKARERITNALIGMILALGSYVILFAINPNLVSFQGLQFLAISPDIVLDGEHENDAGDVITYTAADIEPNSGGTTASGLPKSLCHTIETCRPYCQRAKCTATLKDFQDPNDPTKKIKKAVVNCANPTSWPRSAPGIIDASQAVNAQQYFTQQRAVGIKATQSGDKISKTVGEGLVRAGKIADREGYRIEMTDGWRDLPTQFLYVCERITKADFWRPTKPDVADTLVGGIGSAVAWPGGSLHGAGFAADIRLIRKSDGNIMTCSGCCDSQGNAVYKEPSKIFDQIMTEAGAKRYAKEIWHFEFGGGADGRCQYPNCPWPPSCRKSSG